MILNARYRLCILMNLVALALICSCNSSPDISPNNGKEGTSGPDETILLSKSVKQPFSDLQQEDLFKLTVTGESIVSGKASFEIISSKGRILHTETFPAKYLLGYADDVEDKPQQKDAAIIKRVSEFFNSENFSRPAIKPGEAFDSDYSDREIWENIKNDTSAVGFYYLIGEENGRKIAYCKKLRKVVVFFSCC